MTLSTFTLAKLAAGESEAYSIHVTGAVTGYPLRRPVITDNVEQVGISISDLSGRIVWSHSIDLRTSQSRNHTPV